MQVKNECFSRQNKNRKEKIRHLKVTASKHVEHYACSLESERNRRKMKFCCLMSYYSHI